MSAFDPAVQAALVRVAEILIEEEKLTTSAAEQLAGQADLSDRSDAALRREARRIAQQIAQPNDFIDGRAASYYRALRRNVLEERKAKRGSPVDLNERLRQANPLLERLGQFR